MAAIMIPLILEQCVDGAVFIARKVRACVLWSCLVGILSGTWQINACYSYTVVGKHPTYEMTKHNSMGNIIDQIRVKNHEQRRPQQLALPCCAWRSCFLFISAARALFSFREHESRAFQNVFKATQKATTHIINSRESRALQRVDMDGCRIYFFNIDRLPVEEKFP